MSDLVATFRVSLTTIKDSILLNDLKTEQGYIKRAKSSPYLKEHKYIEFNHESDKYGKPYKIVEIATGKVVE